MAGSGAAFDAGLGGARRILLYGVTGSGGGRLLVMARPRDLDAWMARLAVSRRVDAREDEPS